MRINSLSRPDPLPADARNAPPLPLPVASADGHAVPAPFAKLLRQTQATPATPPPTAPSSANGDVPSLRPDKQEDAAPEADASARPHPPARTKPRNPEKPAATAHALPPADTSTPERSAAVKADSSPAAPSLDPALAAWLTRLQAAPGSARTDDRAAASDGEQAVTDAGDPTRTKSRVAAEPKAGLSDLGEQAAHGKQRDTLPDTLPRSPAAHGEANDARQALAAPVAAERNDLAPALNAAAFTPTPTALREAPPPAAVALATPLDAPEFSQMLGLQVSLLAQGGVQMAELHLNPADMGPVSVQIVMDGQSAQVDFGADVAATRHAIEAGLPELASALREAGFTLTGGGVSQHSRGRHREGASAGGPDPTTRATRTVHLSQLPDLADAVRAAARRTVRLGGLDLYA